MTHFCDKICFRGYCGPQLVYFVGSEDQHRVDWLIQFRTSVHTNVFKPNCRCVKVFSQRGYYSNPSFWLSRAVLSGSKASMKTTSHKNRLTRQFSHLSSQIPSLPTKFSLACMLKKLNNFVLVCFFQRTHLQDRRARLDARNDLGRANARLQRMEREYEKVINAYPIGIKIYYQKKQ